MLSNIKTVKPRILVLEGLWDDTSMAIRAAGGIADDETPWTFADVEKDMKAGLYDALVLTGGSDICPSLYDEKPHARTQSPDKMRDYEEYRAMDIALELKMPVLGICRGSQIMNAFRGGSLRQHIDGHVSTEHPVYAAVDGKTFRRAINSREMECISLHHQCMATVGPDMRIGAWSHEGTPEAIESKDGLWLGVQFHPELAAFENGNAFAIFQWLVREAARYSGGKAPRTKFRTVRAQYLAAKAYKREQAEEAARLREAQRKAEESKGGVVLTAKTDPYYRKQLSPPKKARKAGDPAIPSMREEEGPTMDDMEKIVKQSMSRAHMEKIVEQSMSRALPPIHLDEELQVCSRCGLLFDNEDDRSDHEFFVCGVTDYGYAMEPPADHPAWNIH